MADPINLRRERKRRQRTAAEAAAADNRLTFGRTRAERALTEAVNRQAESQLDGHRRGPPPGDPERDPDG